MITFEVGRELSGMVPRRLVVPALSAYSVPALSFVILRTHRWVRGLRDTAVSALPLNGTILVSGVAILAPTAYLSLAPLPLLFGDSSSGTSST